MDIIFLLLWMKSTIPNVVGPLREATWTLTGKGGVEPWRVDSLLPEVVEQPTQSVATSPVISAHTISAHRRYVFPLVTLISRGRFHHASSYISHAARELAGREVASWKWVQVVHPDTRHKSS